AEPYHQQYLDKNPAGYCGIGGTGVKLDAPSETNWGRSCPTGIAKADD
ncbi:MAG TPA: peptide-methionine (S)-S-oxide reductase, partial [Streptomyces sp.]